MNKVLGGPGTQEYHWDDVSFCYLTAGNNWESGSESCHIVQGFIFLIVFLFKKKYVFKMSKQKLILFRFF